MPEAIEADSYFTSGGFTMDVIPTGTNDVTSDNVLTTFSSTVETFASPTYSNSGLTYILLKKKVYKIQDKFALINFRF